MISILRLALNDLRLTLRDRSSFVWMLALPLAMMWIFGNAFRGSPTQPKIHLTVLDQDGGWLARAFVEEVADETINLVELEAGDFEVAENKVRSLIIPAGFTRGALAGEEQTLRFEREPGSNAEFGVAGQMHVVRAIVRTVGRLLELELSPESVTDDAAAASAAGAFRELGERPPLVALEVSTAGEGRPVPGGFNQSVPGTLTMVVLMMTLIYGAVFLTVEKRSGMLRRQAYLPLSPRQVYLGKLCGRLLLAGAQIVILVVLGPLLFDFSWGGSPLGIALVLASFAIASSGLATLLGAVLDTPGQASAVGWIGSMVMAALGGCWWPPEVMPPWLWNAAHALPTAWAMEAFHELISFGRGIDAVLLPCAVLLAFGALAALLGGRFLRFT